MELFEHKSKERMSREAAAERLRVIADHLARHNDVEYVRDGIRFTVEVPDEIELEVEVEVEDGETEVEITLSW